MKLKDKVAIVSGGSRDIGRAISVKLAREGAKVAVNFFDVEEDADETLAIIAAEGKGNAIKVGGDMTKAADVAAVVAATREAFGDEIHILANVVGGLCRPQDAG